ncbi:hypothetical protein KAU11_00545 [Candidatus Babeliales bacterium]|nr:hypothetical protein [Candidatus Babeliales bacterium]
MQTLNKLYDSGNCIVPESGRYSVEIQIGGKWQIILEKKIKDGRGTNHFPVFLLRHRSISCMTFRISMFEDEVLFVYDNKVIIDRLKKISADRWLGKVYCRNQLLGYFYLTKI